MLQGSVRDDRQDRYSPTVLTVDDPIPDLSHHPDAEALLAFDHPRGDLVRWRAVLTAKAWIGGDLGCFFADAEHGLPRVVLIFPESAGFRPPEAGCDMRFAALGELFELDVRARRQRVRTDGDAGGVNRLIYIVIFAFQAMLVRLLLSHARVLIPAMLPYASEVVSTGTQNAASA